MRDVAFPTTSRASCCDSNESSRNNVQKSLGNSAGDSSPREEFSDDSLPVGEEERSSDPLPGSKATL